MQLEQQLADLAHRIEHNEALDAAVDRFDRTVPDALREGPTRDLLGGAWLGHALHPVLTDLPLGCWTGATLLDLLQHRRARPAVQLLTGLGILAAVPTAVTGASEWKVTPSREDRRVGVVHAAANSAALACYVLAWSNRRKGHALVATALGLAGGAAAAAGGWFGGHLSFARGVGVGRTEPDATVRALSDPDAAGRGAPPAGPDVAHRDPARLPGGRFA